MVLWQNVMLCGNTLLRVQLARCALYATAIAGMQEHMLL